MAIASMSGAFVIYLLLWSDCLLTVPGLSVVPRSHPLVLYEGLADSVRRVILGDVVGQEGSSPTFCN